VLAVLGARLARRIALPLVLLILGLFLVLGYVAVRVADAGVTRELDEEADRIAAALEAFPPEHRLPQIVEAMARLMGVEIVVGDQATRPWLAPALRGLEAGTATIDGVEYRVLERPLRRGAERCLVLFEAERVERRRRDALVPVVVAGALGLLVALLLGLAVARAIARPVRHLADSVKGVAAGAFTIDVGPRGPGEIGELQDAFVAMVREIRAAEERLRESERFAALGRLAGGIAHELRNPLTAIRMAVETAAKGNEESRAEARDIALSEIERLDRTLREMLDYVRPREPKLADVDAGELLADVAALLTPQCEHLRVKLETEAEPGLVLRVDADRMKQALLNLVLNAAQAQPQGGVVRVRARAGAVEVADEGPGIPAEVRETLLQPFVTTKAAGIGLGLAVVAQVAEEHGARLEYETSDNGTTFRLVWPADG
jgi:signal transduction histidine kinase